MAGQVRLISGYCLHIVHHRQTAKFVVLRWTQISIIHRRRLASGPSSMLTAAGGMDSPLSRLANKTNACGSERAIPRCLPLRASSVLLGTLARAAYVQTPCVCLRQVTDLQVHLFFVACMFSAPLRVCSLVLFCCMHLLTLVLELFRCLGVFVRAPAS